jgi:hypothetical protein
LRPPLLPTADDATAAATTLHKLIDDKLAVLQAAEEATIARAHVRAIALLLEEEQAIVAALDAKVAATAHQVPSSSASSSVAVPPPPLIGDEYVVIANLHAQACVV